MEITLEDLEAKCACVDGIIWFKRLKNHDVESIVKSAIRSKHKRAFNFCIWGLVFYLEGKNRLKLWVFLIEESRRFLAEDLNLDCLKLMDALLVALHHKDATRVRGCREQADKLYSNCYDIPTMVMINTLSQVSEFDIFLICNVYMYDLFSQMFKAVYLAKNFDKTARRFTIKLIRYGVDLLLTQEGKDK